MGNCAELCAAELGYTREQQDAYTATSYARAAAATANDKFADEIFTVMVPGVSRHENYTSTIDACHSYDTPLTTYGTIMTINDVML